MNMKITRLTTFWDASEAWTVIEFLDTLRDQLWESYAEQIITLLADSADDRAHDADQLVIDFDDDPLF